MSAANRRVKRWPGWVALVLVVVGFLAVGVTRDAGPQTEGDRIDGIARRIACPICDGESVYESRNNASVSIRTEIEAQVREGVRTDDEIIGYIADRYRGDVLLVPRATGLDTLVWALPVAALVCGLAGLAVAFRRWRLGPHARHRPRPTTTTRSSSGRCVISMNPDRLAELEEERRFLLRSLADLEREHDAGDVDADDYQTLREGYTVRAASVLRSIDEGRSAAPARTDGKLAPAPGGGGRRARRRRRSRLVRRPVVRPAARRPGALRTRPTRRDPGAARPGAGTQPRGPGAGGGDLRRGHRA